MLDEYTQFVEIVRKYEHDDEEAPVEMAIDHCISNHILEDFLRERRAEVLKAMTIDMTFERREELIREEEREEGRKEGIEQGIKQERVNTERERKRAEEAEKRVAELEAQLAAKG